MQGNIIEYYPQIIKQIKEMQQIARVEDAEFLKLKDNIEEVIKNMFLFTTTETGIIKFETMLGIKPREGQSIEERKKYLYYNMNQRKMTLSEISELISDLKGKLEIDCDAEEIKIWVDTQAKNLQLMFEMLDNLLPLQIYIYFALEIVIYLELLETKANILLQSNNDFWESWKLKTGIKLKTDTKMELSYKDTIAKKHRNLWHLDGSAQLNGNRRLNAESIEEAF